MIDDAAGSAIEFDGVDDGLHLPQHPLSGVGEFTAEVIFRPAAGGSPEQRFLHLQEDGSKDRILFEIRLISDDRWFLDTYIKSAGEGYTLFAKRHVHPVGPWYHAALVVEGGTMRHYVNGDLEISRNIPYRAQGAGRSSIGVRINEVSWFRGAIRQVRFTPRALSPHEFLPWKDLSTSLSSVSFPASGREYACRRISVNRPGAGRQYWRKHLWAQVRRNSRPSWPPYSAISAAVYGDS